MITIVLTWMYNSVSRCVAIAKDCRCRVRFIRSTVAATIHYCLGSKNRCFLLAFKNRCIYAACFWVAVERTAFVSHTVWCCLKKSLQVQVVRFLDRRLSSALPLRSLLAWWRILFAYCTYNSILLRACTWNSASTALDCSRTRCRFAASLVDMTPWGVGTSYIEHYVLNKVDWAIYL